MDYQIEKEKNDEFIIEEKQKEKNKESNKKKK